MRVARSFLRAVVTPTVLSCWVALAHTAAGAEPSPSGGTSAGTRAAGQRLPSQFTVELRRDGTLFADGVRLGAASELAPLAERAVARGTFSGAAVFAERAPDRRRLGEVLERAGFASVRSVERGAPPELTSSVPKDGSAPVRLTMSPPPPRPVPPSTGSAPATRPRSAKPVSVSSMGLHIGGGRWDAASRKRVLRAFEAKFDGYRRCHPMAKEVVGGATVGVDVVIPKAGGQAAVREMRTRLSGRGFEPCMRRAFESIRFPAPPTGRPETVSYSVLFKSP